MKFGNQEWRRCGENAFRQIEGERKGEIVGRRGKEKEAKEGKEEQVKKAVAGDRGVAVEVQAVDKVETVRPKRKQGGEQSTGARPQLRRPVLPLLGGGRGVNGKGTTSEVVLVEDVQPNPTADLADSFNRGLKVNTQEVICAESTVTAPAKVKYRVTDSPVKVKEHVTDLPSKNERVTDPSSKVEEPWEPLWMRQMKENGASLNLTGSLYPQRNEQEPVGRAIWSPPKARGRGKLGEGRGGPLRWAPPGSGDSLFSS